MTKTKIIGGAIGGTLVVCCLVGVLFHRGCFQDFPPEKVPIGELSKITNAELSDRQVYVADRGGGPFVTVVLKFKATQQEVDRIVAGIDTRHRPHAKMQEENYSGGAIDWPGMGTPPYWFRPRCEDGDRLYRLSRGTCFTILVYFEPETKWSYIVHFFV